MDELLIRARNKEVKINLQAKYSEHFLPKQMPVYCIDNSLYHNQNSPLAVEVSGIPDLRRYCLSLPGRALFRSADTFLESRLPALINSLEIWLEAAHNAGTQSLSDVVDLKRVRDVLGSMLNDWKASFSWMCNDSLRDPCSKRFGRWVPETSLTGLFRQKSGRHTCQCLRHCCELERNASFLLPSLGQKRGYTPDQDR